jgi:hypothetical protein
MNSGKVNIVIKLTAFLSRKPDVTELHAVSGLGAARELRATIRGRVVLFCDKDYVHARQIWNRAVENQPALLAMRETSADLQAAMRAARSYKLPLSVS